MIPATPILNERIVYKRVEPCPHHGNRMPKAKKTHHDTSNGEHTLEFSGSVELVTLGMPMNTLTDLSDQAPSQVFVTAWIDGNRGKSAHVSFNSSDQETPSTNQGNFRFSLPFRQGDPDCLKMQFCIRMRDTETNNKRSAELYMSYADMNTMLKGHTDRFKVRNQFSTGTLGTVQLRISNADRFRNYTCGNPNDACDGPFLHLSKSKIRMIQQMNKLSQQLSKRMQVNVDRNKCQMPPGGAVFIEGLTSRPFSGRINADSGDVECPPLQTHYALMGPQQECLGRFLPPQVVIYHHYLKMVHSGKTGRSILSLPDAEFGQFFLEGMQLTCCPGLWPYEKDFLPQPGLSMTEGLTLTASGTEDLVRSLHPQFHTFLFFLTQVFACSGVAMHGVHVLWQAHPHSEAHQGIQGNEHGATHEPIRAGTVRQIGVSHAGPGRRVHATHERSTRIEKCPSRPPGQGPAGFVLAGRDR